MGMASERMKLLVLEVVTATMALLLKYTGQGYPLSPSTQGHLLQLIYRVTLCKLRLQVLRY